MTRYYFPFDSGSGASVMTAQWSKMARLWKGDGIVFDYANEYEVYADSTGKQVKVKTGAVWIKGGYAYDSSEVTIALASNNSGNPRIDVIAAEIDWVNNTMGIVAITGTAEVSPVAPALTQTDGTKWQIPLAQVSIANGYTTVAAGDVMDTRKFCQRGQINFSNFQQPSLTPGEFQEITSGEGGITYGKNALSKGDLLCSTNLFKMPDKYQLGGTLKAKLLIEANLWMIDSCDVAWTAGANVTQGQETALMKEGAACQKFTVAAAAGANQIVGYKAITSVDCSGAKYICFWFRTTVALDAGDYQIGIDDTAAMASPTKLWDLPACLADTWYWIELACGDMAATAATISVGLKQVVDKGAMICYIDELGMTGQVILGVSAYMLPVNPENTLVPVNINHAGTVYGTPQYSLLTTARYHKPVEFDIPTKITPGGSPDAKSYLSLQVTRKNDASDKHLADVSIITATIYYPEEI